MASFERQPDDEVDQQTTERAEHRLDRLQGDDVVTEQAVDCAEKERVQGRAKERLPAGPFMVREAKPQQVVVAGVDQTMPEEWAGGVLCEIGETHSQGAEKYRDGRKQPSQTDLGQDGHRRGLLERSLERAIVGLSRAKHGQRLQPHYPPDVVQG